MRVRVESGGTVVCSHAWGGSLLSENFRNVTLKSVAFWSSEESPFSSLLKYV